MTTIATGTTTLSPSVQKPSAFSAMCVRRWRKQKSLCAFAASATATSLLIMAASSSSSSAADSPAQSGCLTRAQAEQTWPHSHLYWHTERHCWDVTPVGQYHRHAYVPAVPATEQQTIPPAVNYQVVEKEGGAVWVKPPAKVTTYYPSLMKGQNPESEWLTPTPAFDWPLLIDIDSPNRFAPWDRRISGIKKW